MASVYMYSGRCAKPLPSTLLPYSEGSALFVKTRDTACGSVGVFTYNLHKDTLDKKMAVMFSVPYDYNLHSNLYAVGIFDMDINCDYNLYKDMYYSQGKRWFDRVNADARSHVYTKDDITIKCKMTDCHEPTLIIDVKNDERKICS